MKQKNDFPNTYQEFIEMFPDDTACAAFLVKLRWPKGFICLARKQSSIDWLSKQLLLNWQPWKISYMAMIGNEFFWINIQKYARFWIFID